MRDQALFDKIDLHLIRVLHTVLDRPQRLARRHPAGHVPARRVGRAQAAARAVGRPAAGALGLGHGADRCRPAHDRAERQHPARGRGAVQRRARLRSADRRHHLPHRRQRLPRPAVPAACWWRRSRARRRCARSRSIRCRPIPTTTRTCRWATSTWSSATGSSRRKTCTWRSCSPTRSCRWSARTIRPCGAAGTRDTWLAAEHIAPTPTHPGARGVIDQMLDELGLQRNITARCAHFGLIPDMVASSLLVLTTGRQYCERFVEPAAGARSSNARSRFRGSCITSSGTSARTRRARRAGCASG